MRMAQRTEKTRERPKRKIGPRSLMTLRQITDRMRRIICASLNSDLDAAVAFRQIRMLERLRLAIASSDFEDRLETLEYHVGVQGGRGRARKANGHDDAVYALEDRDDYEEHGRSIQ